VLRLPGSTSPSDPAAEDWYFSGVYVESGSITTSVGSGSGSGSGGSGGSPPVSSSSTTAAPQTTTLVTSTTPTSTTAAPPAQTSQPSAGSIGKYAQCGGTGWTGSGSCVSGATCTKINDYYSQCL
jgi:hypothetical protein